MPKPLNALKSEKLKITTTPQVRELLDQLVQSGLYGKNTAEAADRLLSRALERLIEEGRLSQDPQISKSRRDRR